MKVGGLVSGGVGYEDQPVAVSSPGGGEVDGLAVVVGGRRHHHAQHPAGRPDRGPRTCAPLLCSKARVLQSAVFSLHGLQAHDRDDEDQHDVEDVGQVGTGAAHNLLFEYFPNHEW